MDKIHVIYGSTTGMTEAVAEKIAKALDAQAFNINAGDAAAFDAELLVLGADRLRHPFLFSYRENNRQVQPLKNPANV